jgi:hypothetical protein
MDLLDQLEFAEEQRCIKQRARLISRLAAEVRSADDVSLVEISSAIGPDLLMRMLSLVTTSCGYALKCRGSGMYFREYHGDDHALDDATLYPTEADAHRVRGIHHRVVCVHVDANGRSLEEES